MHVISEAESESEKSVQFGRSRSSFTKSQKIALRRKSKANDALVEPNSEELSNF